MALRLELSHNTDEMNLNNPILKNFKERLEGAIAIAALVADGNNVVTVSAKNGF